MDQHTEVPACSMLDSAYFRLGALYVAKGSALGGRDLARGLDRQRCVGGPAVLHWPRPKTGEAWRDYLMQLSAAQSDPSAWAEITRGAVETFAAFEHWLNGWSTLPHG